MPQDQRDKEEKPEQDHDEGNGTHHSHIGPHNPVKHRNADMTDNGEYRTHHQSTQKGEYRQLQGEDHALAKIRKGSLDGDKIVGHRTFPLTERVASLVAGEHRTDIKVAIQ